jgi:hypothetical protein
MGCIRKPLAMVVAALCLTAASVAEARSVQVEVTHAATGDFSGYSTFVVVPSKSIQDASLRAALEAMIASELTDKGFIEVESSGDLVVAYDGGVGSRDQIFTNRGYAVETTGGVTTVYTVGLTVPVGALAITVIDRARGEAVWQAIGKGMIKPEAAPEKRVKRMAKAVKKILASCPSRD